MAKKKSTTQTKKANLKKKSTRRKPLKKRPAKTPAKPTTVDGILKAFKRERVTLDSDLVAARKKIETLTNKIAKMKSELEAAKREIIESEAAIETLDERRDLEVGVLLLDMGVDLSRAANASTPKVRTERDAPLFDNNTEQGKVAMEVSDSGSA
jgi:hypothetical protein